MNLTIKSIAKPHHLFALLAILQSLLIIAHFNPFADYIHGAQRYLHVAYLAHVATGGEEHTLPLSYIAYVQEQYPENDMSRLYKKHIAEWNEALQQPGHERLVSFTTDPNPALYSPIAYLPQLGVFMLGMMTGMSPGGIMLASQIVTCAVTIALGFVTLRLLPFLQWPVFCLMLFPGLGMQRIFIMPDAMTVHLSLLFISGVFFLRANNKAASSASMAGLLVLAFFLGQHKSVYALVAVCAVFLPSFYVSRSRRLLAVASIIGMSLLSSLAWSHYAYQKSEHVRHGSFNMRPVATRIEHMQTNPGFYIGQSAEDLSSIYTYENWIRNQLFWSTIETWRVPDIFYAAYALLCLSVLFSTTAPVRDRAVRMVCAGQFAAMLTLITLMCVVASPSKHPFREEIIQGRYMLPFLPLLWIAMSRVVQVRPAIMQHINLAIVVFTFALNLYFIAYLS